MNDNNSPKVIISGGGTGGHIFPALSIATGIMRRYPQAKILFVGAIGRMEMEKVPEAGFDIVGLPVMGFDRKHLLRNFKVLFCVYKILRLAKKILREFNPDIAVGVGGYASGPMLKVAQNVGVPTLIQEQNSYPGVTNKMLCAKADAVCVAYHGLEKFFPADKIVFTGNPVRQELVESELSPQQARLKLGLNPDLPTILVVGGSLGARTINHSIGTHITTLAKSNIQVLWQCGKQGIEYADTMLKENPATNIKASAFIYDMAAAYRAASIVISRAGASSISELQLLGKPVIFVPSPNVAEDHQTHNAMALVKNDAAILVKDSDAQASLVDVALQLINDNDRLLALSENISKMAKNNAVDDIVDCISRIIDK